MNIGALWDRGFDAPTKLSHKLKIPNRRDLCKKEDDFALPNMQIQP